MKVALEPGRARPGTGIVQVDTKKVWKVMTANRTTTTQKQTAETEKGRRRKDIANILISRLAFKRELNYVRFMLSGDTKTLLLQGRASKGCYLPPIIIVALIGRFDKPFVSTSDVPKNFGTFSPMRRPWHQ